MKKPMHRLRAAREQALQLTRAEFATLVERESGESCDERKIWRWEEKGVHPRPASMRAVLTVTGLTAAELGWNGQPNGAFTARLPDSSTAGHIAALVHDLRIQDDTAPTGSLLAPAATLTTLAEQLTSDARRDRDQGAIGRTAAEAATLQWWLTVDAGMNGRAIHDRAMALAAEFGDTRLVGHLLGWRAGLAVAQGDLRAAIRLSRAARDPRWSLSAVGAGWAGTYEVRAHLLMGDMAAAARAAEESEQRYRSVDPSDEPPWLYWVSGPILELDALDMRLAREGPDAAPAVEAALKALPAGRARDAAWYRAHIAAARARAGDTEGAATDAAEAARLSVATGTTWTLAELRQLAKQPGLAQLSEALRDVAG